MRKYLLLLLALSFAPWAQWAFDIAQLMQGLASHPGGKARFTEKKFLAVLDRPIVATGEMTYLPPDRLEKRTLTPRPELLLLDRDTLSIERDKQRFSISLSQQPEARAFVDSIRSTLAGDRSALEKSYLLHLSGQPEKWTLTLLPSDQRIASLIQRIVVTGSRNQILSIEYLQADGDRSLLNIEPIPAK